MTELRDTNSQRANELLEPRGRREHIIPREHGACRIAGSVILPCFLLSALCVLCPIITSQARAQHLAAHDAMSLHQPEAGATVGMAAGYGFFEAGEIMDGATEDGAHHRLSAAIMGALQIGDWARLRASYEGAYDKHPTLDGQSDWGGMLAAAAGADLWISLAPLGLSEGIWGFSLDVAFPGGNGVGFSPGSLILDATTRAQWQKGHGFVGARAGFRFDRSITSLDQPELYGVADRLSLQGSASHGVLAALFGGFRLGGVDATMGVSSTALLDGVSPSLWPTQVWVGAAAADDGRDGWYWFATMAASPQARPTMSDPIVRVLPRAEVMAGIRYRFGGSSPIAETAPVDNGASADDSTTDGEETPQAAPPAPRAAQGRVVDADGAPLEGAFVQILRPRAPSAEGATSGEISDAGFEQVYAIDVGPDGSFRFDDLPPGPLRMEIASERHETVTIDIEPGEIALPETFALEARTPHGELTGLIRDFNGQGIPAVVVVRPGQQRLVLPPDGTFKLDLAPGQYTVRISADGFVSQTRRITLEDRSVVVMNVELRAARSRR